MNSGQRTASQARCAAVRSYGEAMCGSLEIRAVFLDADLKIDLLNKLSA
jgi:hypothetical protein